MKYCNYMSVFVGYLFNVVCMFSFIPTVASKTYDFHLQNIRIRICMSNGLGLVFNY